MIDCEYPLIHRSNESPFHFIHGFIQHLNQRLDLNIKPTSFKGDIHLADVEKSWISQVHLHAAKICSHAETLQWSAEVLHQR